MHSSASSLYPGILLFSGILCFWIYFNGTIDVILFLKLLQIQAFFGAIIKKQQKHLNCEILAGQWSIHSITCSFDWGHWGTTRRCSCSFACETKCRARRSLLLYSHRFAHAYFIHNPSPPTLWQLVKLYFLNRSVLNELCSTPRITDV